jgi:biopolymer transport protein ExbD
MRVPHSHLDRQSLDVPMTPMIDVVFQLLIFFICTASFQMVEQLLPTSLAAASRGSSATRDQLEPQLEQIVVRGDREETRTRWTVNDRPCESLAEVERVLRAVAEIDRSLPVILDVAPDVPLGDMIDVYDRCRIVGFEKIQFAAAIK